MKISGVFFLLLFFRTRATTLSWISFAHSFSSPNVKLSNLTTFSGHNIALPLLVCQEPHGGQGIEVRQEILYK